MGMSDAARRAGSSVSAGRDLFLVQIMLISIKMTVLSVVKITFPCWKRISEAQHKEEERYLMSRKVAITLFLKKVDLSDLKLCLTFHYNITGRSQRQVLCFQWPKPILTSREHTVRCNSDRRRRAFASVRFCRSFYGRSPLKSPPENLIQEVDGDGFRIYGRYAQRRDGRWRT